MHVATTDDRAADRRRGHRRAAIASLPCPAPRTPPRSARWTASGCGVRVAPPGCSRRASARPCATGACPAAAASPVARGAQRPRPRSRTRQPARRRSRRGLTMPSRRGGRARSTCRRTSRPPRPAAASAAPIAPGVARSRPYSSCTAGHTRPSISSSASAATGARKETSIRRGLGRGSRWARSARRSRAATRTAAGTALPWP